MIDYKIHGVRSMLQSRGVDDQVIDRIIESINRSVQSAMAAALESNISYAAQKAEEMRASGFLSDIVVRPSHRGFEIDTYSGNHDFSRQEFPMLSRLLAGGKTAKDGSTYRVIPMGAGKASPNKTIKNIQSSIDGIRGVDEFRSLTEAVTNMAMSFNSGSRQLASNSASGASRSQINFKTASSKQDPARQWVIPKMEADMTPVINEINAMMAADIERAIDSAIAEHEAEISYAIRNA